ncbi:MAG: hypothetical protein ACFBSG_18955 [Leptolyngbyaceae cyanobacterium]
MSLRLPFITPVLQIIGGFAVLGSTACGLSQAQVPPRNIPVQQQWTLQPGSDVGGFEVIGGLGDVSINLQGDSIKAPFDGRLQPSDNEDCVAFTSPEVPAYLFRLCGVQGAHFGDLVAGQTMGRAQVLQFAAMRRQPDGTWAIVEPATDVLKKTLGQ